MFFLISSENPDNKCVILGGKVYVVGRRDCDILLSGDATVSRKHAELTAVHTEANISHVNKLPILRLKDLSKFGTWVNSQRVQGERILHDGDTVYFGSQKSSFMVVLEPLVVTSSCLDQAMKKSVKQYMVTLSGHLIPDWQHDCTLLVMSKISVTIKVICALVSQKFIVLPTYLDQYIKHLHGKAEKPDPSKFTPDLAETQLDPTCVTFNPDSRRKSLFSGIKFYFLTEKQLKKMQFAIELAGGLPILLERGKMDSNITKPGSVVMNCTDTELSQSDDWVTRVQTALDKKKKHMILDAEIGYAVLYCSTEKHCNPDYVADEDLSKLPSQSLSQVEPFVPNTDTQTMTEGRSKRIDGKLRSESNTVVDETRYNIDTQRTQTPKSTQQKQVEKEVAETKPTTKEPSTPVTRTPLASKKRHRLEEEEDDDDVTNKRIKKEPVTPCKSNMEDGMKKTTKTREDNVKTKLSANIETVWDSDDDIDYSKINTELIEPQGRTTRLARKTSPKPDSKEQPASKSRRGRSRSPVPSKPDHPKEPGPKSRRGCSRSPSPKPDQPEPSASKSRRGRSRSPVPSKPDHPKEPAPKSRRGRSRSPSPKPDQPEPSAPKSRRGRSRSPSPKPDQQEPPASKSRRGRSRSPYSPKATVKSEPVGSPSPRMSKSDNVSQDKADGNTKRKTGRGKCNIVPEDPTEPTLQEDKKPVVLPSCASEPDSVPVGFISTRHPVKMKGGGDGEYDEDLPTGCINVEMVSLVVRRTRPTTVNSGDCPEGFTRWKGKLVRNFKKFRKTHHAGSQSLPNIIGGSDLEVHLATRSKELDDWFKDSVQTENEHNAEDRRIQKLFELQPGTRRGR